MLEIHLMLRDHVRYDYAHAVLKNPESYFKGKQIAKDRRISIICRNKPQTENIFT